MEQINLTMHEKSTLEVIEKEDQQHQQLLQQQPLSKPQPKRAIDSKNEEERRSIYNNGEKDEQEKFNGRERLKKHRREVAGKVWIPDMWGQEEFLKDWIDCTAFDASLVSQNIMLARACLMEEGRTTSNSNNTLLVEKSC